MSTWINRQKNILDFALSSLFRRKGKLAALALVYTAMVFLLASVLFLSNSIEREAALILQDAPELIVQKMAAGRHELIPEDYLKKIRGIRGVIGVKGRLWGYYYDPIVGANYTLMVSEEPGVGPGTIAVGEGVARVRLAVVGDSLEFRTHEGNVVELAISRIFPSRIGLISSDLVLISEADFRGLFGVPPGMVTDLALKIRNPREFGTIALKVAEALPDTRQILREEILRTYEAIFSWRSGILLAILSGALLAFIILAWDKASGLSLEERREIGILKAIGWETSDVLLMKGWEGAVISLSSFLAGTLLAYGHVYFTSSILFEPVLKGWGVLYPQFALTPYVDPAQVAALFFLTVAPYTVATVIPAWRAATVDPDTVMR